MTSPRESLETECSEMVGEFYCLRKKNRTQVIWRDGLDQFEHVTEMCPFLGLISLF